MTITTSIARVLVDRFGAIRADHVETTRRNELIDQIELQSSDVCIIAVGRTLAKAKAIDGRRAVLAVSVCEGESVRSKDRTFVFEDDAALRLALDWIRSGAGLETESTAINHATGAFQRNAELASNAPGDEIDTVAAAMPEAAAAANDHVARTLVALDHGAPETVDAVPPSVRKVAALLGCSVEAAAYIDALESRVAHLEEKVSELWYDVRRVRRVA